MSTVGASRAAGKGWAAVLVGWVVSMLACAALAFVGPEATAVRGLEVLSVIASWPVAFVVLLFTFGARFHAEIAEFVANVVEVRFGSASARRQDPLPPQREGVIPDAPERANAAEAAAVASEDPRVADLARESARANQLAVGWHFEFLKRALVPRTQSVLAWIAGEIGVTPELVRHTLKEQQVGDAEVEAINNALKVHGLVEERNGLMRATPYGRAFVQYLRGNYNPWPEEQR